MLKFCFYEIDVTRAAVKVKSLTSHRALTSAREPKELTRGAHEPRPTRRVDVRVRGAIDGVDGAVTQLQPLTVEQERHHVEKARGEQVSVGGREAHRAPQKGPAGTKARHSLQSGGRRGRACQGGPGR